MRQDELVAAHVRALVRTGELRPGDKLPTQADLAKQLGVNRNSVFWGFATLRAQGIIIGVQGGRAVVSKRAPEIVDLLQQVADEASPESEETEEL